MQKHQWCLHEGTPCSQTLQYGTHAYGHRIHGKSWQFRHPARCDGLSCHWGLRLLPEQTCLQQNKWGVPSCVPAIRPSTRRCTSGPRSTFGWGGSLWPTAGHDLKPKAHLVKCKGQICLVCWLFLLSIAFAYKVQWIIEASLTSKCSQTKANEHISVMMTNFASTSSNLQSMFYKNVGNTYKIHFKFWSILFFPPFTLSSFR